MGLLCGKGAGGEKHRCSSLISSVNSGKGFTLFKPSFPYGKEEGVMVSHGIAGRVRCQGAQPAPHLQRKTEPVPQDGASGGRGGCLEA